MSDEPDANWEKKTKVDNRAIELIDEVGFGPFHGNQTVLGVSVKPRTHEWADDETGDPDTSKRNKEVGARFHE